MKKPIPFGGYRTMWLMVMFDLPTDTPKARRRYRDFRNYLLQDGFDMLQFSVYARHTPSEENATVHIQGKIAIYLKMGTILKFTDKQFCTKCLNYLEK